MTTRTARFAARVGVALAVAVAVFGAALAFGIAVDDEIPGVALPASPVRGSLTATDNPYALDRSDVYAVKLGFNDRFDVTMAVPPSADFDAYLFAPGTRSVASGLQPPFTAVLRYSSNWALGTDEAFTYVCDRSVPATCFLDAQAWKGAGSYALTWRVTKLPAPTVVSTAPANVGYQRSAPIAGMVTLGGRPLSGLSAEVISNPYGAPLWTKAADATSTAGGGLSFSVTPVRQTRYRIKTRWAASSRSGAVGYGYGPIMTITPRAYLAISSEPIAPTHGRAFTVTGVLKPSHAAANGHVVVGARRRTSSGWDTYRTFSARSSGTGWSASVTLPSAGTWLIMAVASADTLHVRTVSPYRYLAVK